MSQLGIWFSGLRMKLLLMVVIPLVLIVASILASSWAMDNLQESLQKANFTRMPLAHHSGEMRTNLNGVMRWLWTAYLVEKPEEVTSALEKARTEIASFSENQKAYLAFPRSEKMTALYRPVEKNWDRAVPFLNEAVSLLGKRDPVSSAAARDLLIKEVRPLLGSLDETLSEMASVRMETSQAEAKEEVVTSDRVAQILHVSGFAGILFMMVFGFLIASRLATVLGRISEHISDAGAQVSAASSQLSAASQQVSSGATEAASSLAETVASTEELSSMVRLNSDNAKQAAMLAQSSCQSAEEGEREIRNLIASMTEISASSKKIEEIINVIDDIAFQTNLLALNAAVEAARAGEQGKGFAVVAEAVRNLAQRSASAAKDITTLIQDSVRQIETGSKTADSSGHVLKNIVGSVKKVSDLNSEIASASAEQSNGITQITKAMNELDRATQQNASASEEVAASSEEMSSQAQSLQSLVVELIELVEGRGAKARDGGVTHHAPARRVSGARPQAAPASRRARAENVIPFGDESLGKVGTTDGF